MRKRIDRFIEEALISFGDWYVESDWLGKERDCVNIFAHGFLAKGINPNAAIRELTQIRVESGAPQPKCYTNKSASKDLVIWKDPLGTMWDKEWNIKHIPWVVMEWKMRRRGRIAKQFDAHDVEWLSGFRKEYAGTFGYLVSVYHGRHGRSVSWAKVRGGEINATNRRS